MTSIEDKRKKIIDTETGTILKRWKDRIRIALVYPNYYSVGMSNLGFQTVYQLLNEMDHVVCERFFLPEDTRGHQNAKPRSIESGRPLLEYDCIAFSLSFENDYANILPLLDQAGLPMFAVDRGANFPLIMAGGVASFLNPEPIAPFFDCFVLGEAETCVRTFFENYNPGADKQSQLLELVGKVPGLYVPGFYRETYFGDGRLKTFEPAAGIPSTVKRSYSPDLSQFSTQSVILSQNTSFENAHLIEVSRGCPHGCRFCSAGFVYRPPRVRSADKIAESMQQGAQRSSKIGLLGTAVSDLPGLKRLCHEGEQLGVQVSFSSLRADALDEQMAAALKSGRVKTATIAPEAGSDRMLKVINKGLTHDNIFKAASALVTAGIPNLKLYFMIGLPTETADDVEAIVDLVKKIKHQFLKASQKKGRMGIITVSLNAFVPKPFTPFQWAPMDEINVLKDKIKRVKKGLGKVANVRVHADIPRWAHIQGLLSRGDRRVAQLLLLVHKFKGNWPQTFKNSQLNPSFYVHRQRNQDERLPWDFIDNGVKKEFLWNEYQKAKLAQTTVPCPMEPSKCKLCGVCG
ncbi:MAG: radical SAM protein [Desulfobacteraceae bacterium]|nr:radical SAM protein [Desulfobacteraceae bacterium]